MIVIMGVSGCGKTTIGKLLADKLRLDFYDADDFHPEANIKKMKKAIPLTDKDRIPWLERLANEMMIWEKSGGGILSCSALKEDYRQILSSQIQHIDWIYLSGTFDLINSRLKNRQGHYMRTELLKSQFDVLEVPHNSIKVDIKNSPEEIVNILLSKVKHRLNSGFGVIGLGVMGKSIALNVADKGYNVSVYNRTEKGESEFVKDFLVSNADKKNLFGFTDLNKFVKSIERPRKILLMVKAGKIVDIVIENLLPFLDKDDIVIDGGNSHFLDTKRRSEQLVKNNIQFIGAGISGGEEGARYGPSIMPGGSEKSYKIVAPILEAISAKDVFGKPCCTYIGPEGAGIL